MELRKPTWLLVAGSFFGAACAPPPVAPASAVVVLQTRDNGASLGPAFRAFSRKHHLIEAEAIIPGGGVLRPIRRRDAIRRNMQILSSNAAATDLTDFAFYRGGISYKFAPESDAAVVAIAKEFCLTMKRHPDVISVRATKGAAMEVPANQGCEHLD